MAETVAASAAAGGGRPISVRFCESAASGHSITSFTELSARSPSRPPVFDGVDAAGSVLQHLYLKVKC